jgi:hypothetical protein
MRPLAACDEASHRSSRGPQMAQAEAWHVNRAHVVTAGDSSAACVSADRPNRSRCASFPRGECRCRRRLFVATFCLLALCGSASSATGHYSARGAADTGTVAFQVLASVRRALRGMIGRSPHCTASSLVDSSSSDGPMWQRFADWAGARGIRFDKWRVGDVGGGLRGAIAAEDLREGTVLVSAPSDAVLSVREADACPLPATFVDPMYWDSMAKKWEIRMALLLLYQKRLGVQSKWAPYFQVLPSDFGLPLTFSEDELEQLQYQPFIQDLRVEREFWNQQLEVLKGELIECKTLLLNVCKTLLRCASIAPRQVWHTEIVGKGDGEWKRD